MAMFRRFHGGGGWDESEQLEKHFFRTGLMLRNSQASNWRVGCLTL